ncbi:MAG: hypothetical protein AAF636_08085 [Pseudomonadota bacterium]
MDPDLALVIGLVMSVLSVPSIVSALADRRAPRVSAVALLLSGVLLLYAFNTTPIPYTVESLPRVFATVLRNLFS